MIRIFLKSIKYSLAGHFSIPLNAFFALTGLLINNVAFFLGIFFLIFNDHHPVANPMFSYYLQLTGVVTLAYGILQLTMAGLSNLGKLIENGQFDSYSASPRHPLWLVAASSSSVAALGDILQGSVTIMVIGIWMGWNQATLCIVGSAIALFAFIAVAIVAGSLSFYSSRGSTIADLLNEVVLTFSVYPTAKISAGSFWWLKYASPAFFSSILPLAAIEKGSWIHLCGAAVMAFLALVAAICFFNWSVRRYRSTNYVQLRS